MIKNYTQYYNSAKTAYEFITTRKMDASSAWDAATKAHIISVESRKKGCPKNAFIGLCDSGDLKQIKAIKQSERINYLYAKFAIVEWKKDPTISKYQMWKRIVEKFGKAKRHQGQLDVVMGLMDYLK